MLAVSSSCFSSDDHVILSSADKPFALPPLSFPPNWTRGRGCKKMHTHPRTSILQKECEGFPMVWSPSKSIITSTVTHNTHLPHNHTLSGRQWCPCMLTDKIHRGHSVILFHIMLHYIANLFRTVVWWRSWCRSSANTAKNWTANTASTGVDPHRVPPFYRNRSDFS